MEVGAGYGLSVNFSPSSRTVFFTSCYGSRFEGVKHTLFLYDTQSGAKIAQEFVLSDEQRVKGVLDDTRVVVFDPAANMLRVIDLAQREQKDVVLDNVQEHQQNLNTCRLSPCGGFLMRGHSELEMEILRASVGAGAWQPAVLIRVPCADPCRQYTFSKDDTVFAVSRYDVMRVDIYATADWKLRRTLPICDEFTTSLGLHFSPDLRFCLLNNTARMRLFDVASGQEICNIAKPEAQMIELDMFCNSHGTTVSAGKAANFELVIREVKMSKATAPYRDEMRAVPCLVYALGDAVCCTFDVVAVDHLAFHTYRAMMRNSALDIYNLPEITAGEPYLILRTLP